MIFRKRLAEVPRILIPVTRLAQSRFEIQGSAKMFIVRLKSSSLTSMTKDGITTDVEIHSIPPLRSNLLFAKT